MIRNDPNFRIKQYVVNFWESEPTSLVKFREQIISDFLYVL